MISLIVSGTIPMKVIEQCLVLDTFNAALVTTNCEKSAEAIVARKSL